MRGGASVSVWLWLVTGCVEPTTTLPYDAVDSGASQRDASADGGVDAEVDAGTWTPESYCTMHAAVDARRRAECFGGTEAYYRSLNDALAFATICEERLGLGERRVFDPSGAQECIDAISNTPCRLLFTDALDTLEACLFAATVGLTPLSAGCVFTPDCRRGLLCMGCQCLGTGVVGSGERCTTSSGCPANHVCVEEACRPNPSPGDDCLPGWQCPAGLVCRPSTGRCESIVEVGSSCWEEFTPFLRIELL